MKLQKAGLQYIRKILNVRSLYASLLIILLCHSSLQAITEIYLLDGSLLKGRIISRSNNIIQFEYKSTVIMLDQSRVQKIVNVPDQTVSLRTRDGNILKGYLLSEDHASIKIRTSDSNEIILIRTNLAAIELNEMRYQPGSAVMSNNNREETDVLIEPKQESTNIQGNTIDTNAIVPTVLVNPKSDKEKASLTTAQKQEFFFDGQNAFRSAVLPSWGQFKQAHYIRGGIVSGIFILSAAGITTTLIQYSSLKSDYLKTPTHAKYSTLKNYYYGFFISAGTLILSYAYGIADAGIQYRKMSSIGFEFTKTGRRAISCDTVDLPVLVKKF